MRNLELSRESAIYWHREELRVTSCKNKSWGGEENSRTVGSGVYLSVIELEDVTESLGYQNGGPKEVKKLFLGVGE